MPPLCGCEALLFSRLGTIIPLSAIPPVVFVHLHWHGSCRDFEVKMICTERFMKRVFLALILVAVFGTFASAQQFTYYFPQVAAGTFPGGSWKTTIFISNAEAPGTTASGAITLTASDGSNWSLPWVDDVGRPIGSGNTIAFTLGSGEVRKFVTVATAALNTGYATVTANAAVLGTAMFSQLDGAGNTTGEAGVPAAIPLGRQAIFVDTTSGYHTGVAIANPNTNTLVVHYELVNTVGQIIMSNIQNLGPLQHISFFIDQMFPNAPAMVGRFQFYCTNPMASIGLRFNANMNLFTTIPPIAISELLDTAPEFPAVIRRERWLTT
jgi:hypothetical protein